MVERLNKEFHDQSGGNYDAPLEFTHSKTYTGPLIKAGLELINTAPIEACADTEIGMMQVIIEEEEGIAVPAYRILFPEEQGITKPIPMRCTRRNIRPQSAYFIL